VATLSHDDSLDQLVVAAAEDGRLSAAARDAWLATRGDRMKREFLDARYDVTGLDEHQRGKLALAVVAQSEPDDEFQGCPAPSIEWNEIVVEVSDTDAVDRIRQMLDGVEWSTDTLEHVADVVRETGRLVNEPTVILLDEAPR
jgi:hypothetical protein